MDATIGDITASVERVFEKLPLPRLWEQVTFRVLFTSLLLSVVFGVVTLQIQMTAGIIPGLNMPISVLSFFFLKWFANLLRLCGGAGAPSTRQETLLVLTAVVTVGNLAVTGGFAMYITAMTSVVAKSLGEDHPDPRDIVDNFPTGQWMLFLFLIGLLSIFTSVPLNEIMILDYRLLFPTGTAQAHLINSFHTPQGAYIAKLQVASIFKFFMGSFSWAAFSWLYSSGKDCGFSSFPSFGLELYKRRFFFDFSPTYIGVGMIVPPIVIFSLLLGSLLSWGSLFPFLQSKKGDWYHTESTTSLAGINGYKIFITVALIIADGLFNFVTLAVAASMDYNQKRHETDSVVSNYLKKHPSLNYDDRRRLEVFLDNRIPVYVQASAYAVCAAVCCVVIPGMFDQIEFYHLALIYVAIPVIAFTDTYAVGLTDWNIAYTFAKFTIFVVSSWIAGPGAVVGSLVSCGVIVAALHVSSQATQDVKTGYMTMTSQRALVIMQIFGVAVGSVITPCIYRAFQRIDKAHTTIGAPDSKYPCPYAGLYRAIAVMGMGGVKELPTHCLELCAAAAGLTFALNTVSLVSQRRGWWMQAFIPNVTVMALPFFIGTTVAIDMSIGFAVLYLWTKANCQSAMLLSSAVAAGLICGEGLFALPSSMLNLFSVEPPMCMKFLTSGKQAEIADQFLRKIGATPP